MKQKPKGSSFDSWLREEGIYEEATGTAINLKSGSWDGRRVAASVISLRIVTAPRLTHRVMDGNPRRRREHCGGRCVAPFNRRI